MIENYRYVDWLKYRRIINLIFMVSFIIYNQVGLIIFNFKYKNNLFFKLLFFSFTPSIVNWMGEFKPFKISTFFFQFIFWSCVYSGLKFISSIHWMISWHIVWRPPGGAIPPPSPGSYFQYPQPLGRIPMVYLRSNRFWYRIILKWAGIEESIEEYETVWTKLQRERGFNVSKLW